MDNGMKKYSSEQFVEELVDKKIATNNKEILTINNYNEYIPTQDYHPATKKYVDDSVKTIASFEEATKEDIDALFNI